MNLAVRGSAVSLPEKIRKRLVGVVGFSGLKDYPNWYDYVSLHGDFYGFSEKLNVIFGVQRWFYQNKRTTARTHP